MKKKSIVFGGLFFLLSQFSASAQDIYMAGSASESLNPKDESFSLALAGYAGPWAGRFTLNWTGKGPAENFPNIVSSKKNQVPARLVKTFELANGLQSVLLNDTIYSLGSDGVIKRSAVKKKKPDWQSFKPLPKISSFVIHNHDLYASDGSDTLWKMNTRDQATGWKRAGYSNGFIKKVNIKRLYTSNQKLYAVSESDSLFEAGQNYGKPQEEAFARAVAIRKDKKTVLILCLDLCGINADFTTEVKKELSKRTGMPADAILVNASHTHFMPGTQAWLTWAAHSRLPDSNYLEMVVRPGILKAAETALKKMKPSTIYFGRGTTAIGQNRSNGGNPGPYDDAVDVLKIESQDGKNNSVLVLSGCHPVGGTKGAGHFTISSNYPGFMRSAIENKMENTMALFMQGCAGDINPKDEPEVTGMKLATDALSVLNKNMKPLSGDIIFALDSLQAATTPMSREETEKFRDVNVKAGAGMEYERNVSWANLMLDHYDKNKMPAYMPVYIHTVNIGNWKLVGLSRETVTEYSFAIKKIWPDKLVSVAGYCNDVSSYLPVARHITTGVYEGVGSYFWYGQPSSFPLNILDLVVDRIKTQNN